MSDLVPRLTAAYDLLKASHAAVIALSQTLTRDKQFNAAQSALKIGKAQIDAMHLLAAETEARRQELEAAQAYLEKISKGEETPDVERTAGDQAEN